MYLLYMFFLCFHTMVLPLCSCLRLLHVLDNIVCDIQNFMSILNLYNVVKMMLNNLIQHSTRCISKSKCIEKTISDTRAHYVEKVKNNFTDLQKLCEWCSYSRNFQFQKPSKLAILHCSDSKP